MRVRGEGGREREEEKEGEKRKGRRKKCEREECMRLQLVVNVLIMSLRKGYNYKNYEN